jgi:tripartite-type tricarboxylate transporter receptor subunit TctC
MRYAAFVLAKEPAKTRVGIVSADGTTVQELDLGVDVSEAAKQAANDERVRAVINGAGSPIQYMDAPEFKAYWDKESAQMGEVVKKIGKVE